MKVNEGRFPPIHPGDVLKIEFLEPLGLTAYRLGKRTGIPASRLSAILNSKRLITVDTAARLAAFFGNSPRFWLNLQTSYDLQRAEESIKLINAEVEVYSQAS